MANKKFTRKREKPEYDQKLLDLARVTRVVKGGRRFSFRATLVIGNRKGKVGMGVAKGADVSMAITKAFADAQKNIINVKRMDSTISFDVREKFGAAKVMIKPAKEGRGIVAGGAMRAVLELAGIKNVTAKSLGSSNKINVARATLKALTRLEGKKASEKDNSKEEKKEGSEKKTEAKVEAKEGEKK